MTLNISHPISRETNLLPAREAARVRRIHEAAIKLRRAGYRIEHLGGRSWRLIGGRPRVRTLGARRLVAIADALPSSPPA